MLSEREDQPARDNGAPVRAVLSAHLTHDSLVTAMEAGARVIVSGPASPYCHAANVLRYWQTRGRSIQWCTVPAAGLPRLPDSGLVVDAVAIADGSSHFVWRHAGLTWSLPLADCHASRAGRKAVVCLHSGDRGIVAMAGRRYDRLAASVMSLGLARSADWLVGCAVTAEQLASGEIALLGRGLTHEAIDAIARSPTRAGPFLMHQAGEYEGLLAAWARARAATGPPGPRLAEASGLLERFFAVALLLHETYTDAMALCIGRLGLRDEALARATPEVLRWQANEIGLLPARKDLFEAGPELPMPPFGPAEDLSCTTEALMAAALPVGDVTCLEHLARVWVLKEWKFFLAKALHRHFSCCARAMPIASLGRSRLRRSTISDLLATEGAT